jgi:hypothetical protein
MERDRRQAGRRKFYFSDDVRAELRGGGVVVRGFVADLSPFGAAIAVSFSSKQAHFSVGAELNFTLRLSPRGGPVTLRSVVVSSEPSKASGQRVWRIGLSFVAFSACETEKSASIQQRRKGLRFACSDFWVPSVWCEHPLLYQEKILFRVVEFGSDSFTLETSARNKVLFKGLKLAAWISVPGFAPMPFEFTVARVGALRSVPNRFCVAAEFAPLSPELCEAIAQYCLMVNSEISVASLRKAGFVRGKLAAVVVSDYVHTEADIKQILRVRGKFDGYDQFARQMVCKAGNKVVAAARLIFNDGKRQRSALAKEAFLPSRFWEEGFVELSYWMLSRDFDENEMLNEIVRSAVRVGLLSRCRYVLMGCGDDVLEHCLGMGAQKLDLRVARAGGEGKSLEVLHVVSWDCQALRAGWGGSPSAWASAFGPLLRSLTPETRGPLSSRARMRMALERYEKSKKNRKSKDGEVK